MPWAKKLPDTINSRTVRYCCIETNSDTVKETQNIEFKQRWRDDFLAELCGFANAQGGTLYIGVDDNGKVVGVENAKQLLEKLPNLINQTMGLLATINLLTDDGKEYKSASHLRESICRHPISSRYEEE